MLSALSQLNDIETDHVHENSGNGIRPPVLLFQVLFDHVLLLPVFVLASPSTHHRHSTVFASHHSFPLDFQSLMVTFHIDFTSMVFGKNFLQYATFLSAHPSGFH
jgi:hypothetical protein